MVSSGESSDEAPSDAASGRECNPIELDDSTTASNNSNNSENENETPTETVDFKEEGKSDNEGENESDQDGDDSGKDGDQEVSEGDHDNESNVEGEIDRSGEDAEGDDSESENKSSNNDEDDSDDDGNSDNEEDEDNEDDDEDDNSDGQNSDDEQNSDTKESEDASTKERRKSNQTHLWGDIESMSKIVKSPYEGNECAEVGEDCFEEFRVLMDGSESKGAINPRMIALVGDKLAQDLSNAHYEIGKSGMLYSANWKEGKIRDSDFGWIPKRQLLLCLHEHRFAKANAIVLQAVTKNLDCTRLVLEAMKLWDLMDTYPNLASNKNEESFAFAGVQKVFCYKCQIFVARAFATLQILNKTERIQQSLTRKVKACLTIMNKHVRVNQIELARMTRKAIQARSSQVPNNNQSKGLSKGHSKGHAKDPKKIQRRKKSETLGSKRKVAGTNNPKPKGSKPKGSNKSKGSMRIIDEETKPKRKRRRKIPKREEREESIFMLFNTMQVQVQRLNQMMGFFQSQLQEHRSNLRDEIRENIEAERSDD